LKAGRGLLRDLSHFQRLVLRAGSGNVATAKVGKRPRAFVGREQCKFSDVTGKWLVARITGQGFLNIFELFPFAAKTPALLADCGLYLRLRPAAVMTANTPKAGKARVENWAQRGVFKIIV